MFTSIRFTGCMYQKSFLEADTPSATADISRLFESQSETRTHFCLIPAVGTPTAAHD